MDHPEGSQIEHRPSEEHLPEFAGRAHDEQWFKIGERYVQTIERSHIGQRPVLREVIPHALRNSLPRLIVRKRSSQHARQLRHRRLSVQVDQLARAQLIVHALQGSRFREADQQQPESHQQ